MNYGLLAIPAIFALASGVGYAAEPTSALVTQTSLSASGAAQVLQQAVKGAAAQNEHPCIAVDDASGFLVAFTRMEGAPPGCADAAIAKAHSAAINGVNTVVFYDAVRLQHLGYGFIPGILPAVAGVVIRHGNEIVGSIGVAGGPSDASEQELATTVAAQFAKTHP